MNRNKQAFTLIELLVVVLIIAILAAIALPQYQFAVEKARATEGMSALKTVATAMEIYYLENGTYPNSLSDLDIKLPTTQYFTWVLHSAYIGAVSKTSGYMLARGLQNSGSASYKGRYSCSMPYVRDYQFSDYDTDSLPGKICRNLCNTDTLGRVWGSSQPGCVISR